MASQNLNKQSFSSVQKTDTNLSYFHHIILELIEPKTRENALICLSKEREKHPNLAPLLWHSFGTVTVLLQELLSVYPYLHYPEKLQMEISTRCCNSLAIMQCIAMHPETRTVFIESNVPLYIFPFINIRHHKSVNLEKIRLTGLGVFGSLLQSNDPEVVKYLIQTEIVPLCLKILREATEISQTVAAYIIQKILIDRQGLEYVCATSDRFFSVSDVLIETVEKMINKNSIRLLKHIIHCYLCLSANRKARNALRKCLPSALRTNAFEHLLSRDSDAQKWLNQLIHNLSLRD